MKQSASNKIEHQTPLHYFAQYATSAKKIKSIIQKNYKINSINDNLYTPLMIAAKYNKHSEVIEELLKAGANIQSLDKYKKDALQLALESNPSFKVVEKLLSIKLKRKNKLKQTPLMLAARSNPSSKVIEGLIKHGEDVNATDIYGFTPLMYAAATNTNPSIIKTLIKNGADINATTPQGINALHIASGALWLMHKHDCLDKERYFYASNPNAIKALIKCNADINSQDKNNNTPLLHSIIHQVYMRRLNKETPRLSTSKRAINELLRNHADPNITDKDGMTPLMHYIYSCPEIDIVKLLLKSGADVNIKTPKGLTAMSFTREIHPAFRWDFGKERWGWKNYNIAAKLIEKYIS